MNKFKHWELILLVIIVAEFVIFGLANPKFLIPRILLSSINDIISICIISLFVTLVMITGGIDIQVASLVGLSSITIGVFWQDFGLNIWLASLLGVVFCAICGAISGFFIGYIKVQAMIITLGGSFLYSGIALSVSNLSQTASYKGISGFPESFLLLSKYRLFGVIPSQLLIFLLLVLILYIVLEKTKFGRKVFLVGVNENAAKLSGINTNRVIMLTYVLSAISAAIAGIILTSYIGTSKSDIGATFTLPIITSVVLGGTLSSGGKGSVIGTALASIIIGLMRFGLPLCFKVNSQYLDIPLGLLLLVIIVGRSIFSSNNRFSLRNYLAKKANN